MKIHVFKKAQFKNQNWKNGRGSTLELYRHPDNDQYDLRLSLATVAASGAFSKFQGYHRTIIQLAGSPMTLHHPDLKQTKALEILSPYHFDGEWHTDGDVTTSVQDFNVIYKKGGTAIQTTVLNLAVSEKKILPRTGKQVFVFCAKGGIEINTGAGGSGKAVFENELCVIDRANGEECHTVLAHQTGATVILVTRD